MKREISEEIKRKTEDLFSILETGISAEDAQLVRTEIFDLNLPIVLHELQKLQNRMKEDFYIRNQEDYEQALKEALWEAILKYKPGKNAGLYSFASSYLKHAISDVTRDDFFHGAMSRHGYAQLRKLISIMDAEAVNGDLHVEAVLKQIEADGVLSVGCVEALAERVYSIYNHVPVHEVRPMDEGSSFNTEKMFFDMCDLELLGNIAQNLSPIEKEMLLDIIDDELGKNNLLKKYRDMGYENADTKYIMQRTREKVKEYYWNNYGCPFATYSKRCNKCDARRVYDALCTINDCLHRGFNINPDFYDMYEKKEEKKEKRKYTKRKPAQQEPKTPDFAKDSDVEEIIQPEEFGFGGISEDIEKEFESDINDIVKGGEKVSAPITNASIEAAAAAKDILVDATVKKILKKRIIKKISELTADDIEKMVTEVFDEINS